MIDDYVYVSWPWRAIEETIAKGRKTKMAFHLKNGWYFERITEPNPEKYGWVRIYHIAEGEEFADSTLEIDSNSWASVVASVSQQGEDGYTFNLAKAVHGTP